MALLDTQEALEDLATSDKASAPEHTKAPGTCRGLLCVSDSASGSGSGLLLARLAQRLELGVGQGQRRRRDVLFQMRDRGRAGDEQDGRGALQQPGQGELGDGGVVGLRGFVEHAAGLGQLAASHGEPGDEADAVLGAVVEQGLGLALGQVVKVLDRDDVYQSLGVRQLVHGDFGQADVADLALGLQLFERPQRLLGGDLGVDAVELIKVDGVRLQAPQAHLDALADVLGPPDGQPLVRPLAGQAALGGDDQAVTVGG